VHAHLLSMAVKSQNNLSLHWVLTSDICPILKSQMRGLVQKVSDQKVSRTNDIVEQKLSAPAKKNNIFQILRHMMPIPNDSDKRADSFRSDTLRSDAFRTRI